MVTYDISDGFLLIEMISKSQNTLLANKNGRDCIFGQYLREIFTKFKKEGQFCNLLVLSFSKLTLLLIFGQVEAEKIEIKDTRGHFHFFT